MRLNRLTIFSQSDQRTIRRVEFNEKGITLIVDDKAKVSERGGSNIGKTTFLRLIDCCLGAKDIKAIYTDKDNVVNLKVKKFLEDEKICVRLEFSNEKYVERQLFGEGKLRTCDDGQWISAKSFNGSHALYWLFSDLNKDVVKFRTVVPKFVRIGEKQTSQSIKYVEGGYTSDEDYKNAYYYLFLLLEKEPQAACERKQYEDDLKELKRLNKKYKISTKHEFDEIISGESIQVEEQFSEIKHKDYADDFLANDESNHELAKEMESLEIQIAGLQAEIDAIEGIIEEERSKIQNVDLGVLKELYDDASKMARIAIDFEKLVDFHNGMVKKRLSLYQLKIDEKKEELDVLTKDLKRVRASYSSRFVEFKKYVNDTSNEGMLSYYRNFDAYKVKQNDFERYSTLEIRVKEFEAKKEEVESTINQQFFEAYNERLSSVSKEVMGEKISVEWLHQSEDFPLRINSTFSSTSDMKLQTAVFDLSLVDQYAKSNIEGRPYFEIHDKMENMTLESFKKVLNYCSNDFDGQYIFAVLWDRIKDLNIDDRLIKLRLSEDDKLFRIENGNDGRNGQWQD